MMGEMLELKAKLLSASYIQLSPDLQNEHKLNQQTVLRVVQDDNLYQHPWIFLRLNDSCHVRMVVLSDHAPFELCREKRSGLYNIKDCVSGNLVACGVRVENVLFHSPGQLFFSLYENCVVDCKFCPLSLNDEPKGDSLSSMLKHINSFGVEQIHCIGITSGIPLGLDAEQVALEIADVVKALREKVGNRVPIGVSPKQASRSTLFALKNAGADEVRLNIEIFDIELAKRIIPNKPPAKTLQSIKDACEIFGKGKVSSNIILGLGESDASVIDCIRELASLGAIATLYPYDSVPARDKQLEEITNGLFGRPSADRLMKLSIEHKKILLEYKLEPNSLLTMCPMCAASHLMPGKDL